MSTAAGYQPLREPLHDGKKLSWECQVSMCGEKVVDPMIHSCELCDNPILVYGRLIPCKHVFCFACAQHNCEVCPRCNDLIQHIEMAKLGTVFLCTYGAPRHSHNGCRRTYLSQRDLQAHIGHRHGSPSLETSKYKSTSNPSLTSVGSVKQISPSVQNPEYSINTSMAGLPISSITSSAASHHPPASDYQPVHRHSAPPPQPWPPQHHPVVTIPPRAPPHGPPLMTIQPPGNSGVIGNENNNYQPPPNHHMPPPVYRSGPPPSNQIVPQTSGVGGGHAGTPGMGQGGYMPRQQAPPQQIRQPHRLPPPPHRMQHPSMYGQPPASSPVNNGHQQPLPSGGRNPNLITIPIQGHPGDPHGAPPPQHYQQHNPHQPHHHGGLPQMPIRPPPQHQMRRF